MSRERIGRGLWRGVYTGLFDHPDFQRLSPTARLTLLTLRLSSVNNIASIFRLYLEALAEQTGFKPDELDDALRELETTPSKAEPWILRDGPIIWIRKGLRHDPSVSVSNDNHLRAVLRAVSALPSSSKIVRKFKRYYKIGLESHRQSPGRTHPPKGFPKGSTKGLAITNPIPNPNQTTNPKRSSEESASSSPPLQRAETTPRTGPDNGQPRSRPPKGTHEQAIRRIKLENPGISDEEAGIRALSIVQAGIGR